MNKIKFIIISVLIIFSSPQTIFASEAEGISLLPGYLNLVIFLILLPFVLKVLLDFNLFTYFKERKKKVSEEVEVALKEKQSALDTFNSLKVKIDKINEELDEMSSDAKTYGEKIKNEVLESSKQRAHFLIEEGKLMMEKETLEAQKYLRKKLLQLSTAKTEEKLRKRLGKKEHSALIDNCIKQMERV